ncbi:hypothetical protein ACKI1I_06905 [Streptomyces turgidiscabies]|uniref:Uncharacterized protein n=1 Tax=Streptomyces turgidiscabies (strain Car8) TaxID=698760 RepID=L7F0V0_STRT8|nr:MULTISPECIES: hypothetical protein [Streptomyces]ELP64581.1 hypothetical protein STRTUCAR8_09221 [Streptomyces turgidiscabies Car8]MDX3491547.1 hypothetical protein [Streptomyces turgidiscabies]GAQ73153.1 hypothetical protein T45_04909 [Streptomyces turgidiscabies]
MSLIPTLAPEEIDALEPTFLGPTWAKEPDGSWKLPEHTLGWQIAGWCAEYLKAEDGGPWRFTREQLRFLLWWYAVDEAGRFTYRKGVLQRLKGWGKDPLLAVISLVEFVGPSRFLHWGPDGQPVGVPHPQAWVQIAAVSRDQTRNTAKGLWKRVPNVTQTELDEWDELAEDEDSVGQLASALTRASAEPASVTADSVAVAA